MVLLKWCYLNALWYYDFVSLSLPCCTNGIVLGVVFCFHAKKAAASGTVYNFALFSWSAGACVSGSVIVELEGAGLDANRSHNRSH